MQRYDADVMSLSRFWLSACLAFAGAVCFAGLCCLAAHEYYWLLGDVSVAALGSAVLVFVRPRQFCLGFEFTGPIQQAWGGACHALGFVRVDEKGNKWPLGLADLSGTATHWRGRVLVHGIGTHDWAMADRLRARAADMAAAMGVSSLSFYYEKAGKTPRLIVVASMVKVPMAGPWPQLPAPKPVPTALDIIKAVPVAVDMLTGEPYRLPLLDGHVLIAGMSRAGKAGYVWGLVMGLIRPIAAGYVRLWGIDPKGIELGICLDWWDVYADSPETMVELLERAVREMWERKAPLKGQARKFTPSPSVPLNLIFIDELAYVTSLLPTEKPKNGLSLQQRADRAITEILTQGAGLGYILVGAVQDPRKETVPNRDLWSTCIALRLRAQMVNLVLGPEAKNEGALCHLIPSMSRGGAGQAFVDIDGQYRLVYARWYEDQQIVEAYQAMLRLRESLIVGTEVKEVHTDKLVAAQQSRGVLMPET
jgi:DNA segregation ATPase FtsK/SpoIIIE, S-DNA-T family